MKTTTIYFTDEQRDQILPILAAMRDGEACMGQVYIDGVRLRPLDEETTLRIQAVFGEVAPDDPGARSIEDLRMMKLERMSSNKD